MNDFWLKTSGTWLNVATVVFGTGLGLLLRGSLPQRMQQVIIQGMGIVTLFIGLNMANTLGRVKAGRIDSVVLAALLLGVGGILGEWWQIEERLARIGDLLKEKFKGGGKFTEGFVAASLLFCVGPMTLVGSLNNGLNGDYSILALKAMMDGLVSIAFGSSYGVGVGCSALTIIVVQGGISLLAGSLAQFLPDPATAPQILLMTGVGGLLLLGLGLNLLEIGRVPVAAFLPALFLAPLAYAITAGAG